MAEKMNVCSVQKEKGYLYYVAKMVMFGHLKWLEVATKVETQKKLLMLVSKESLDGYTL